MLIKRFLYSLPGILLILLLSGCSQEPPVEKEIVRPAPQPARGSEQREDAGMVGSSHQQEAALAERKTTAEAPAGADQPASPASPVELEAKEGYRIVKADSGQGGELHFLVPEGWREVPTQSPMRLSQITLPAGGEGKEEGELTVFYFGPSAGTIQMNIDRWIGQFSQPDGGSSKERAQVEDLQGEPHPFTLVDLSGTMLASGMPGAPATPERPGWRLLASIIRTPSGPWFIKATGPEETMAAAREGFIELCKSAKLAGG